MEGRKAGRDVVATAALSANGLRDIWRGNVAPVPQEVLRKGCLLVVRLRRSAKVALKFSIFFFFSLAFSWTPLLFFSAIAAFKVLLSKSHQAFSVLLPCKHVSSHPTAVWMSCRRFIIPGNIASRSRLNMGQDPARQVSRRSSSDCIGPPDAILGTDDNCNVLHPES